MTMGTPETLNQGIIGVIIKNGKNPFVMTRSPLAYAMDVYHHDYLALNGISYINAGFMVGNTLYGASGNGRIFKIVQSTSERRLQYPTIGEPIGVINQMGVDWDHDQKKGI